MTPHWTDNIAHYILALALLAKAYVIQMPHQLPELPPSQIKVELVK